MKWNRVNFWFYLASLISCINFSNGTVEVLKNSDFESSHFNGNWYCAGGCSLTLNSDSYEGSHSVKVSHRDHRWKGLTQDLDVQGGRIYKLTAYMKLLNVGSGHMYEEVETIVACTSSDGHQKFNYFGSVPMMQANNEWYEVGGTKQLPTGSHNCRMYFQTTGGVNYLVDQASMKEITQNSNWKAQADADIDRIRKSNITISLKGHGISSSSLDIEIKHEFGFGTAVRANQIVEPSQTNYMNAFLDNFEWAVFTNFLKWFTMEYNRGRINYHTALTAINALRNKGIKIRGHNVFWGVDKNVQPWVQALSKQDLLTEMDKRIKGVIGHTKGLLEHWDVNNENLNGDFYERHTGNPNITMDMFRQVHAVDGHPKLFLNDYGIVVNANKAVALKDQAKRFRTAGVPIYGVGIQSHLHGRVDITGLKARLDTVAEAGLPIWITELSVSAGGDILRASILSDVMHVYFSHPSVEGVLLWGFWDGEIHDKSAALFHGQDVIPNRAGKVWQQLFKEQWRTNVTSTIRGTDKLHIRGFRGTYQVKVRHGGNILKTETFVLGKNNLEIQIQLSDSHMKSLKERIIMTDRTKPKSVSKTQRRCRNHFREIQLQAKHVTTEVTHPRTDCTLTVLYREIHEELKINGTNFQCIDSYTKHFDMKHRNDGSKFDTPEHSPELHILRKCETLANRSYFNKIPNPFTRTRGSDSAIETKLLEDMDLL